MYSIIKHSIEINPTFLQLVSVSRVSTGTMNIFKRSIKIQRYFCYPFLYILYFHYNFLTKLRTQIRIHVHTCYILSSSPTYTIQRQSLIGNYNALYNISTLRLKRSSSRLIRTRTHGKSSKSINPLFTNFSRDIS